MSKIELKCRSLKLTVVLFLSYFPFSYSQNPITMDMLSHVFFIKIDTLVGTGFLIGDSTLYLVTARHLFKENYSNTDSIIYEVNGGGNWIQYRGILLLHENPKVDIALIKPNGISGWNTPYKSEKQGLFLGEEVRYLGFPYNISSSRKMLNRELHYPVPILKMGMHNGQIESDNVVFWLFEGHNNSGFSGGPIFAKSYKEKPMPLFNRLVAVVSGFYPGVFNLETDKGTYQIAENSGIMIGTPAFYISEILHSNGVNDKW